MSSSDPDPRRQAALSEISRRLGFDPGFRRALGPEATIFIALPEDRMAYVFLQLGRYGAPCTMIVPVEARLVAVRFDSAPEHEEPPTQGVGSTATVAMLLEVLDHEPHLIIHESHPNEFAAELVEIS